MVTCVRFVGTIGLLFVPSFKLAFYIIYTICGLSDAVDGYLARKFNAQSEKGAVLDTIADLLFYAVLIVKILPYLWNNASRLIWVFGGAVAFLRIISYTFAAIKYHRFASLHTYGNKLTGFAIFTLPYTIFLFDPTRASVAVCIVSAVATLEELILHIQAKEYNTKRKSIFMSCK